ncbi:MAG: aldo/keto reductase [Pseudomonadota bacterium]
MRIAPLGLGAAGIGNLYRAVREDDAVATVHAALAASYGLIDTAPYYGHGLSEMRVGAALRTWQGARPQISSKVGRVLDPVRPEDVGDFGFVSPAPFRPRFDYSRDGVRRSLDESLERLGVESLDIALVHDVGAMVHGDAHAAVLKQVLDETLPALHEARDAGVVGRIGLGINEWEVGAEIAERAPLDVILLAGRYTLLEQPALTSGFLDYCHDIGIDVLAAGVFNSGLLATPPSEASTYNYAAAPADVLERARALWAVCAEHGVAPQAAALQFPAMHPAVASVVLGARSVAEIAAQKAWRGTAIPDALWDDLKRRGFIAPDAPTRS